ncbi:MAG: tRNA (adenosine(37)-N6)-dimethylallyltransferase MiaA [Candidatus Puniceispirillum sp.]|nr:tRNA (adenosine(37)-N6)-dimethylallyltransferase MiaA [Candidatus Puniceispirillum sp.]
MTKHYIMIAGPTASGKSKLSIEMAIRLDGVIINADSMQLYKDLHVITARPSDADMALAAHRLYGVLDGNIRASVAMWLEMAATEMQAAWDAGKIPIIIGGTGMYLNAGLSGLASIPEVPRAVHDAAVALHTDMGGAGFRQALAEFDPVTAARLFDGDTQRLIRAMGVVKATGRPISAWQEDPHEGAFEGVATTVKLLPDRDVLYKRINDRFDMMIEAGALDEVKTLCARNLDGGLPVMKALGVRQLSAYLDGDVAKADAIHQSKQDSRHYAKRQMTWLRNNFNAKFELNKKYSESFFEEIFANLCENRLT